VPDFTIDRTPLANPSFGVRINEFPMVFRSDPEELEALIIELQISADIHDGEILGSVIADATFVQSPRNEYQSFGVTTTIGFYDAEKNPLGEGRLRFRFMAADILRPQISNHQLRIPLALPQASAIASVAVFGKHAP
jgi:hypothetical protein